MEGEMAMYRQVYFQGTDNKLWGINLNGTDGVNIGGYGRHRHR